MSLAPKVGGKLREGTSGVDRSQAVFACWGFDPVEELVCRAITACRASRGVAT